MSDYQEAKAILNSEAKSSQEAKEQNDLERLITTVREERLLRNPIQGNFDFEHIAKIHRSLFQELYDHAGQARTEDFVKHIDRNKGSFFEKPEKAIQVFNEFSKIVQENGFYKNISQEEFVDKFTEHYAKLNFAHPFEEGNGRSLRIFMSAFAREAGYDVEFPKSPLWNMANYLSSPKKFISFEGRREPSSEPADTKMLRQIFSDNIKKQSVLETLKQKITKDNIKKDYPTISDNDAKNIELFANYQLSQYQNPIAQQAILEKVQSQLADVASGKIALPDLPTQDKGKSR